MKPVKIILDTDMGGDCDDTGALAVLHALADRGECELLAVTHCFHGRQYAGCIDAINRFFGRPDLPVAACMDEQADQGNDVYATWASQRYPNRFQQGERVEDTLPCLRRTLAEAEEGEVTLVAIGSLYSLRRLLESKADPFSTLSDKELIQAKVAQTVVMGGRFHHQWPEPILFPDGYVMDAEFNIKADIPSAQVVCAQWPGKLVFCSYEIGYPLITGRDLQRKAGEEHPVAACYRHWHEQVHVPGEGRESWDLTTVLYAVRPKSGLWKLSPAGSVSVDERGVTRFTEKADGRHFYLLENADASVVCRTIDSLLE